MWDDFKLTISEPAVIRRIGKMEQVLDIAERVEDGVRFKDGSFLKMSAQDTTDSSYLRLDDFWFPVQLTVKRVEGQLKQVTLGRVHISFWKRHDSRCLVMFDQKNSPENNFNGDYKEALDWIVEKLKNKFA